MQKFHSWCGRVMSEVLLFSSQAKKPLEPPTHGFGKIESLDVNLVTPGV